jgi:polyhydroxybutyrate depolymerase
MEFWRVRHGCTGQKMSPLPHRIADDPTSITLVQWTGCAIDDGVRLYRVNGGGHRVPTLTVGPEDDWAKKVGRQNHDIETIDAFWGFAKRFAKE